jgi:FkbM family methyltransferase
MNIKSLVKIANKLGLLEFINFQYRLKMQDTALIIPVIKKIGLGNIDFNQSHQPFLDGVIKKILDIKNGTFIDVGVNIGQTLLKVKSIDLKNGYLGFEPNPVCCFYVNELIKINQFKDCKVIPVGLSDKSSLLKIFMKGSEDTAASLVEGFREEAFYSLQNYVPVFEGDSLLVSLNLDSISVIKIDVEGAELEVIKGLYHSLFKYQPYILCEILPVYDTSTERGQFRKQRQDLLVKILAEIGYKIFRLLHDGKIVSIEQIESHSDLSLCDYVFIPEKQVEIFFDSYKQKPLLGIK